MKHPGWRHLVGLGMAMLLGACSELAPPQPSLEVVVTPEQEVVVDTPGSYTVGRLTVRGTNLPQGATATVSLVGAPDGVSLSAPTSLTPSSTPSTQELKLGLNPNLIFAQGQTTKSLSLSLRISLQGVEPITKNFTLNLRRTSGGGNPGGSNGGLGFVATPRLQPSSVNPGGTLTLAVNLAWTAGSGTLTLTPDLPQGFTANPASRQVSLSQASPSATAEFTVTVGNSVRPDFYPLGVKISGAGVQETRVEILANVARAPRLTLALSEGSLSLKRGEQKNLVAFIGAENVQGNLRLAVEGLPPEVSVSLPEPFPASTTTKTLTLVAGQNVPEGDYSLVFRVESVENSSLKATAPLVLSVAPSPALLVDVSLNRMAVFPGEALSGTVLVRSLGGATGTVAVSLSTGCNLPQGALRYTTPAYGNLSSGGTFTVQFSIDVPGNAPPGLCTVRATAQSGSLQGQGSAQFEILRGPSLSATIAPQVQAVVGTLSVPFDLTLTPENWHGVVTVQVFDKDLNPITSTSEVTYRLLGFRGTPVVPDASGYAYILLDGPKSGTLILTRSSGWSEGEHLFYLRLQGPNSLLLPFKLKVVSSGAPAN